MMNNFSIKILLTVFPILIFLVPTSVLASEGYPPEQAGDSREVRQKDSPKWIEAVGRIEFKSVVRRERKNGEAITRSKSYACSISLVNFDYKDSYAGITAGHCLYGYVTLSTDEDRIFGTKLPTTDFEQRVVFKTNAGKVIERKITNVHYMEFRQGDSRAHDVAVVEFDEPISHQDITPLIFWTKGVTASAMSKSAHKGWKSEKTGKWITAPEPWSEPVDYTYPAQFGVAGYSADSGRGRNGKVLTYHWPCNTFNARGVTNMGHFDGCYSYPGASGGAVVAKAKIGRAWCWNEAADVDAEVPEWMVLLSSVKECEDPYEWNAITIRGETVGFLPMDKPIYFHVGNIKGGFGKKFDASTTTWSPQKRNHREIRKALAKVYGYYPASD